MKNRTIKKAILYILPIVIIICWISFNASKDHLMESKMKTVISNAVNVMQYNVERTEQQSPNGLPSTYIARIDKNEGLVEKEALYNLNDESSVFPFKFVYFSITWIGSSSYEIRVTAIYPGALGIRRKIDLNYEEKVIAFKHETGPDNFSSQK